jgi:hypothetical protein
MNKTRFSKIGMCIVLILLSSCSQEPTKDKSGELINERMSILCKTKEGRPYVISGFQNYNAARYAIDILHEYGDCDDVCVPIKMDEIKR